MPEEFVADIISGAVQDSSSTASVEAPDKTVGPAGDAKTLDNDQSSKPNESTNSNADTDQSKSKLSVEELATQLGWRADHEGDDAVDAATYILRSKDIQKSMSKHNKDLKENLSTVQASINALKEHNERVYKAEVKRLEGEIAALKKERRSAVELADVDKVDALDAQIEEKQKDIDETKVAETKTDASTNPIYDEWIKDNKWYLDDAEMAQYANVVAEQYKGAPLNRIYSLVRQKVQEVFPDKFETAQATNKTATETKSKPIGPVSPVDKATNIKGSTSSFSKADLTPEQINIMTQFVKGGIMTEEQYINDIAKMQEA